MTTTALFLDNTYLYTAITGICETGTDEHGHYFIPERTVFYPRGGGQPGDSGYLKTEDGSDIRIISARYSDNGIRHYTEAAIPVFSAGEKFVIFILQDTRKQHAAYHTAGHYLSQLVLENLALPLNPVRGDHTPGKAYLEFEGDTSCIHPGTTDQLRMAMFIDRQARLNVKAVYVKPGSREWQNALIPKNFKPPVNKPLRLVEIESYRPIPCGGTHLDSMKGLKTLDLKEFVIRGSKAILGYECTTDTCTIV